MLTSVSLPLFAMKFPSSATCVGSHAIGSQHALEFNYEIASNISALYGLLHAFGSQLELLRVNLLTAVVGGHSTSNAFRTATIPSTSCSRSLGP